MGAISGYFTEFKNAIDKQDLGSIDIAIELILKAGKSGANIWIIGNGGSASTATHFAADLSKWASENKGGIFFNANSLADNLPRFSALINDIGWDQVFIYQLEKVMKPGDLLIAFSVHGGVGREKADVWSQNLIQAIKYTKDVGNKSIGFSGYDGGYFKALCDVNLNAESTSTPIVESYHLFLSHVIADMLRNHE